MPNHLHGILTIYHELPSADYEGTQASRGESFGKPSTNSIPTIIRSFKSAASKRARESGSVTGGSIWHRGCYERVLRNTTEYAEFTNYIRLNPARWSHDEENPNRIENP
jgi:putative transposase